MTPPAAKRLADLGRVPVTFGELLVCIRRDEGLSRDAFAHRLGVSRTNLWYIERRRKAITPQQAACWARQLGYDQAQFVQLALQSLVAEAGLDLEVSLHAPMMPPTAGPKPWTSHSRVTHAA
jgi:transcriptional regulator with XRE-family HTH domain